MTVFSFGRALHQFALRQGGDDEPKATKPIYSPLFFSGAYSPAMSSKYGFMASKDYNHGQWNLNKTPSMVRGRDASHALSMSGLMVWRHMTHSVN